MKEFIKRVAVSSVMIPIIVLMIVFAFHPIIEVFNCLAISALGVIASWEYIQLVKAKGANVNQNVILFLVIALVLSFNVSYNDVGFVGFPILVFFLSLLTIFAIHFYKNDGSIFDISVSTFTLIYLAAPLGMLLSLLYNPIVDGRWWLGYLLLTTKITDIGAYFAGKSFGRHKLASNISPKKTIEGAVVGFLCAVLMSIAFHFMSSNADMFDLGLNESIVLGIILGIFSQFGDLSESLLKRDANIKDSNSLPGLGGMLDALDSVVFNAYILFIYVQFIKP